LLSILFAFSSAKCVAPVAIPAIRTPGGHAHAPVIAPLKHHASMDDGSYHVVAGPALQQIARPAPPRNQHVREPTKPSVVLNAVSSAHAAPLVQNHSHTSSAGHSMALSASLPHGAHVAKPHL
jgi:hypothetical protein